MTRRILCWLLVPGTALLLSACEVRQEQEVDGPPVIERHEHEHDGVRERDAPDVDQRLEQEGGDVEFRQERREAPRGGDVDVDVQRREEIRETPQTREVEVERRETRGTDLPGDNQR